MAHHLEIQAALARLRGRPAEDPKTSGGPRTVGELFGLLDLRTCDLRVKPKGRRERERFYDDYGRASKAGIESVPCQSRRGGQIPLDLLSRERWAPAVDGQEIDWGLAARWAYGAVQWLKGKSVQVDENWTILGPIAHEEKTQMVWDLKLAQAVSDVLFESTGVEWSEVIMGDPCEIEDGLHEWASCDAYIETYDLDGMEEANPALVLLSKLEAIFYGEGDSTRELKLGEFEALATTLNIMGVSVSAASAAIVNLARRKDIYAFGGLWTNALRGVDTWDKFTDGPWGYFGDAEACRAGNVGTWRNRPQDYFSFIETLLLARKKLESACDPLISRVTKHPSEFWTEMARSIHDAIEANPKWNIPLKEKSQAGSKAIIDTLAQEGQTRDAPALVTL
jgi:hypothetical protein